MHGGATRTAKLVLQTMNRTSITAAQSVPRIDSFYEEERLPSAERSTLANLRSSDYGPR